MTRARAVALICAGALLLASSSTVAVDEYAVTFESSVPVKMRDGVTLRADKAAARGYVVIVQDGNEPERTPRQPT